MAVGVPETDVFAAADRVLARGERPTTERVRAELGRGSPARVGQLLEQWWDGLAKRLAGETRLPELPPAVAEAFKTVWMSATEHGTELAQATIAHAKAELVQEQVRLTEERAEWQRTLDTAQAARSAAEMAACSTEARLGDLQRLADQLGAQLAEITTQREALTGRGAQLEGALAAAQTALAEQRQLAAQEREALQQHVRSTEDRANAEVDRAREETKALRREREAAEREHAGAQKAWRQALEEANAAAAEARREAAREQARAQALEQQLAKLADLPATLEATLSRVRAPRARAAKPGAASRRAASKAKSG